MVVRLKAAYLGESILLVGIGEIWSWETKVVWMGVKSIDFVEV